MRLLLMFLINNQKQINVYKMLVFISLSNAHFRFPANYVWNCCDCRGSGRQEAGDITLKWICPAAVVLLPTINTDEQ